MFAVLAVLAAVAGFLWASWPQNQWVIWEATKFVFYFAVASIIIIVSLCTFVTDDGDPVKGIC